MLYATSWIFPSWHIRGDDGYAICGFEKTPLPDHGRVHLDGDETYICRYCFRKIFPNIVWKRTEVERNIRKKKLAYLVQLDTIDLIHEVINMAIGDSYDGSFTKVGSIEYELAYKYMDFRLRREIWSK